MNLDDEPRDWKSLCNDKQLLRNCRYSKCNTLVRQLLTQLVYTHTSVRVRTYTCVYVHAHDICKQMHAHMHGGMCVMCVLLQQIGVATGVTIIELI